MQLFIHRNLLYPSRSQVKLVASHQYFSCEYKLLSCDRKLSFWPIRSQPSKLRSQIRAKKERKKIFNLKKNGWCFLFTFLDILCFLSCVLTVVCMLRNRRHKLIRQLLLTLLCNLKSYDSRTNVSKLLSNVFSIIRGDLKLLHESVYTLNNQHLFVLMRYRQVSVQRTQSFRSKEHGRIYVPSF